MNTTDDLEQRIADHYEREAPPRAPNWLLTRALDVIETTPPRRTVFGRPWRLPTMPSIAKLAAGAVAVVTVSFALPLLVAPVVSPTASPLPTTSPAPSPSASTTGQVSEAQIIAEGFLASFGANGSAVLTVWDSCESQFQTTDCGHAWRLATGSQAKATGLVGIGDVHVDVSAASGGGFVLTGAGHRGSPPGFIIAEDGTVAPISSECVMIPWPTGEEAGRLAWVGTSVIDTATGAVCRGARLAERPISRGGFTADGALWGLVDDGLDADALTLARFDGAEWRYRDLAANGGSWTSLIAAAGSNVVVLQAPPEISPQQVVGIAVTTDGGATWSEVVDPELLARDLPFSTYRSSDSQQWFSNYTSIAFAGSDVLYLADGRGDLWRSTDFKSFSRVEVDGRLSDLKPTGDAVIARLDTEGACALAVCRTNDLVRISAGGSVEPITVR